MAAYTIAKRFDFAASHILEGLPAGHRCGRLHGHNYAVEVELAADDLDEVGFVEDYARLDFIRDWLDENFEHRHLNEQMKDNPTAENIARTIWTVAARDPRRIGVNVTAVRVYETPKTCCEYRPESWIGNRRA